MSRWQRESAAFSNALPWEPGVYCVFGDGELLYIGSTRNLCSRLNQHNVQMVKNNGRLIGNWTPWGAYANVLVKFSESRRRGDWAMREIRLITRLRPKFNRDFFEAGECVARGSAICELKDLQ